VVVFGDTFNFASHSPFYRVRGRAYQLITPAVRSNEEFWLPLQFFTETLPKTYPSRLNYQSGTLRLMMGMAATPTPRDTTRATTTVRTTPPAAQPAPPRRVEKVVILDAGHGGVDPGTSAPTGLLEKTVALSITKRLAAFLKERGYEVHLTRTTDTLIALSDRPHMANLWKNGRPATIFVSIHGNSHRSLSVTGFETFFLSEARTDDERRVAEVENSAVKYETRPTGPRTSELEQIEYSLKNDFYLRASNSLAESIQRQLGTAHPGPNRGVKQAGFRVLVGAVMPAVLVEVGFLSNLQESRLLGRGTFQQTVAYNIAEAIDRFYRTHEQLFGPPPE
jgi:N-acetylmuramoyl-L-alanine amidase